MDQGKALSALAALANGTRIEIVRALVGAGGEGLAAGDIARRLGISAPRLSFHLAALEQAGVIASRRVARNVIYTADHAGLGGVVAYILDDCCGGHPAVAACCAAQTGARVPVRETHPEREP